ncbi:MAG: class I SAM-dependent methyltransferase [Xanthobacteraceae bacterium]|nr:class I SAM-dependent methyltransferase [Xanthobacteraceae bacterium]
MSIAFGPIRHCQSCRSEPLTPVVFLGHLPPVSTMYPVDEPAVRESWFPAPVCYCPSCHLVQLGYVEDPALLFAPEYKYTSGTTKSLRENFAALARQARGRYGLTANDLVVDIGSNDGTLLSNFQAAGHRVAGIEPTRAGDIAIAAGIPTVRDFLGKAAVEAVLAKYGKAKIVTAANVFGHMPDIDEVMSCISALLEPDGVFISESDYLLDIVEGLEFDTMYHEHLRYYSVHSIRDLLARRGFEVVSVERIGTHGGSIRVYAAKGSAVRDDTVDRLLATERAAGLDSAAWIAGFRDRIMTAKLKTFELIAELIGEGRRLYGIGAPARSTTLIHYFGLDVGVLDCVLEVSGSKKIGHYIPGTRIPVLAEEKLFEDQPEYALLLSWHIADELVPILRKKGYRGSFIVPLPEPRVIR